MPLGIDFAQILLHMFNVVILFVGLYLILYAPVKKFMDAREEGYKKREEDAKDNLTQAEEMKAEYARKLSEAEADIAKQRKEAEEQIAADKKQTIDAAKAEAKEIIDEARRTASAQRLRTLRTSKEDIYTLIEEATRKVMEGESSSDPYEDFLKEIERKGA